MNKPIKVSLVLYVIVMLGCVIAFFMQKSVIYNDHINPAREKIMDSMGASQEATQSAEHNRYLAEASIRMGHEIEEHLLILLLANLATGLLLVFCILNHENDNKGLHLDAAARPE